MSVAELAQQYAHLTGHLPATGRTFSVYHPGTGEAVLDVPDAGESEARAAIDTAQAAFLAWRQVHPYERSRLLRAWFEAMLAHSAALARLMALEMGKPVTEAAGEVQYAASFVEYYADEARRLHGEGLLSRHPHKRGYVRSEPVGVVYAITPWNFPAAMITRKAAPALAAGCTVILKPAPQSPLTALYLRQLWLDVGGPADALQVLPTTQAQEFSAPLFADLRVRKLTFTGSTAVGKALYRQSADTVKRLSLELGGHAPFIIFEDADIERAAREVANSKFRNAGQTCICVNRVYVHASIAPAFTQALARITQGLKVGDPLDPATQVGPVVDQAGLDKVAAQVQDAVQRGAAVLTGGQASGGLYFQPTVLTDVTPDMLVMNQETFGPVAPVMTFNTDAEAINLANHDEYGLAAFAWTDNLTRAYRVAEALEYGMVGINDGVPSSMAPQAPFGGMKSSGLGREGGHWGLEEYLEPKFVSIGLLDW